MRGYEVRIEIEPIYRGRQGLGILERASTQTRGLPGNDIGVWLSAGDFEFTVSEFLLVIEAYAHRRPPDIVPLRG